MLSNLGKNVILNFSVLLAKDVLPKLATATISPVLDKFEKNKQKSSYNSRTRTHFENKNLDDIKIAEALGITERVKHMLQCYNATYEKGVTKAGKEQEDGILS